MKIKVSPDPTGWLHERCVMIDPITSAVTESHPVR